MGGSITGTAIAANDLVRIADPTTDRRTIATASRELQGVIGETLAIPPRGTERTTGCPGSVQAPRREWFRRPLPRQVIRRFFNHAVTLQAAAGRALRPDVADTLQKEVNEVDAIIQDIRAAIFSLDRQPSTTTPEQTDAAARHTPDTARPRGAARPTRPQPVRNQCSRESRRWARPNRLGTWRRRRNTPGNPDRHSRPSRATRTGHARHLAPRSTGGAHRTHTGRQTIGAEDHHSHRRSGTTSARCATR